VPEVVLGVAGPPGAGKDTLSDLLVEHFGFTKIAFADPMREITAAINPVVGFLEGTETSGAKVVRYNDVVEWHGYNEAKRIYPEVRRFLQRLGTEAGREGPFGPDVWVNIGLERASAFERVVFSDLRFRNEAEAIKKLGGATIRVDRPGYSHQQDHKSESSLLDWNHDLYVKNDGPIEQMIYRLEGFFARNYPSVMRIT